MKKHLLLVGSFLTTLSIVTASNANAEGIYAGLGGGYNMPSDTTIKGTNTSTDVDLDNNWAAKINLGYDFGNNWRAELEGARRKNSNGSTNSNGDISVWSAMGNVIYDINIDKAITPFIGGGLGYAWFDPDSVTPLNGGQGVLSENDSSIAYQAFAGASYNLYKSLDVSLEYRYFATYNQGGKTSNGFAVDSDYKSHDILLSFNWNFGKTFSMKDSAKNNVVIPSNYLVFFDFDKANLSETAKEIISSASKSFKKNQPTIIELTGHTDRAGSTAYNLELSKRRAKSVMAELAALGVPATDIIVYAKGESKPLIATPDGIREPQNRRVEIVIK
ncbi:MAG: OmpA family protein [Alphaproteobacteria bacterium]